MKVGAVRDLFVIIVSLVFGFAVEGPVVTIVLSEIASIRGAPDLVGVWLFTSLLFSLANVVLLGEKIRQMR